MSNGTRPTTQQSAEIEYQVFGVFKSSEKEPAADSGDKDHQWVALKEMHEALGDREVVAAGVYSTATDAIVSESKGPVTSDEGPPP